MYKQPYVVYYWCTEITFVTWIITTLGVSWLHGLCSLLLIVTFAVSSSNSSFAFPVKDSRSIQPTHFTHTPFIMKVDIKCTWDKSNQWKKPVLIIEIYTAVRQQCFNFELLLFCFWTANPAILCSFSKVIANFSQSQCSLYLQRITHVARPLNWSAKLSILYAVNVLQD